MGSIRVYRIDRVEPGVCYLAFWNGDDEFFCDFFAKWYGVVPLLRGDLAVPVAVGNGEDVVGIDA